MDIWEYNTRVYETLFTLLGIELDKMGKKGWELVNWTVRKEGIIRVYECIFKRKKKTKQ